MRDLSVFPGPEGPLPNISPARQGWGLDYPGSSERRRRGTKPVIPARNRYRRREKASILDRQLMDDLFQIVETGGDAFDWRQFRSAELYILFHHHPA